MKTTVKSCIITHCIEVHLISSYFSQCNIYVFLPAFQSLLTINELCHTFSACTTLLSSYEIWERQNELWLLQSLIFIFSSFIGYKVAVCQHWSLIKTVSLVSCHIYTPEFLLFVSGSCLYFAQTSLVLFHAYDDLMIFTLFFDCFVWYSNYFN